MAVSQHPVRAPRRIIAHSRDMSQITVFASIRAMSMSRIVTIQDELPCGFIGKSVPMLDSDS